MSIHNDYGCYLFVKSFENINVIDCCVCIFISVLIISNLCVYILVPYTSIFERAFLKSQELFKPISVYLNTLKHHLYDVPSYKKIYILGVNKSGKVFASLP